MTGLALSTIWFQTFIWVSKMFKLYLLNLKQFKALQEEDYIVSTPCQAAIKVALSIMLKLVSQFFSLSIVYGKLTYFQVHEINNS